MKEIKFRAWNKEEEQYNYFNVDCEDDMKWWYDVQTDEDRLSERKELFTGLRNIEGKEIYEGDILEGSMYGHRIKVRWDLNACGFIPFVDMVDSDYTGENWESAKIIGNIYENPELLGDKNAI